LDPSAHPSVFFGGFVGQFLADPSRTHQFFLADPSRTRPKVFGGKVSRCLKKFGGPIRAPISFWLAGFWWSFWREFWVKVWQPQKVWREVLAGIFVKVWQPQRVLAGSLAASKSFGGKVHAASKNVTKYVLCHP
jgi:hypothetical protein